ncbi:hypothetical protein EI067_10270 [Mycobacterium paragordonae]|uniref:hypothetical protein n=1 Tax=Mycobacterium paragordonae TaxID=1389713 RepID=UPI0010602034|nr:hypothetical protein [Mycobacterium paragordonae]TDK97448.1 hypothetical protein EI067_10270 [Mycobacterium paragordonae]
MDNLPQLARRGVPGRRRPRRLLLKSSKQERNGDRRVLLDVLEVFEVQGDLTGEATLVFAAVPSDHFAEFFVADAPLSEVAA